MKWVLSTMAQVIISLWGIILTRIIRILKHTSHETREETIIAIKKIRAEIRDIPTWYTYNHSA
mgnify:CR=1 FL=1